MHSSIPFYIGKLNIHGFCLVCTRGWGPRTNLPLIPMDSVSFGVVESYIWIFNSTGVSALNSHSVQGSTVFTKDEEKIMGNQEEVEGALTFFGPERDKKKELLPLQGRMRWR